MEECSNRMVAYKGGIKECLWVKDKMSALELRMSVEDVMREGLGSRVMWYSLKYDQRKVIKLGRDIDVEKLIKGNEEYAYVYVAEDEGPFVTEVQGGVPNGGVLIGGHHHGEGRIEGKKNSLLMLFKGNVVVMP